VTIIKERREYYFSKYTLIKILSVVNSLVSRLFKARYFPRSDYLGATIGANPSYIWRSIHSVQNLIRKGARWCIGTGSSIPLMYHPWLANGDCITPLHTGGAHFRTGSVSDLVDPHTKVWRQDLISHLFDEPTTDAILSTPLFPQVLVDALNWSGERNGQYSVRSAYRIHTETITSAAHLYRPGPWSSIWKLKVPPKVKNLVWRVCRSCLPTQARLLSRGVQCPAHCVLCNEGEEDSTHILFTCPYASQVWQKTHLWGFVQHAVAVCGSVDDIVFHLLQTISASQCSLLAMLLWSLWKRRNLKLWQHHDESAVQVVARAKHMLEEWKSAQQLRNHTVMQSSAAVTESNTTDFQWMRPDVGRLKCNVDAAFSQSANRIGIGLCIRDSAGDLVQARTLLISPVCAVDVSEALGLNHAMRWAAELCLDGVDFCLDSKVVVDEFNGAVNTITDLGSIVADCRQLFTSSFHNSKVEFSRRQANRVAHELAKAALLQAGSHTFDDVPPCIYDLFYNEMH
jgi:ribonuclease HI